MPPPLEVEALVAEARRRTGLHELGSGDWREPLERLLASAAAEARLHDVGRTLLAASIGDRLANRLRIEAWRREHPELEREAIEAPLVLATLPRTGQTAAGWILDRDPGNRSLLTWFVREPVPPPPPPGEGGESAEDPRIGRVRAVVEAMPRAILDMHLTAADEPDECHWLISNALRTPHEIYSMQVPGYYRWVCDDPGMRAAYDYYRLQLQLLQQGWPRRRWVLKNSPHLLHLEHLHAVLPDAIYVQLHRDPLKVLASNCRLAVLLRGLSSDAVDPHEVGRAMLGLLGDYVRGLLEFRAKDPSRPWIDVRFADFVADPLAAVAGIYRQARLPLSEEAVRGMRAWVEAHPREDLRRARPADLSPWGLDEEEARSVFADYCAAFEVPWDGI